MEANIRDYLVKYFETNKVFSEKQFRLLKAQSTVNQLLKIRGNW
jgi:hypothetical protein